MQNTTQNYLGQGFLLTRHSFESSRKLQLSYWLSTDNGPVKLNISDQRCVLFVHSDQLTQIQLVLAKHHIDYHATELELKDFEHQSIAGLYFESSAQLYDSQKLLKQAEITYFEGDVRHVDRYLMERFANAGVEFSGQAQQRQGFIEIHQAKLKACDYQAKLSLLSLDVECSRHGELFSIGLYSDTQSIVLMIGAAQVCDTPVHWLDNEEQLLLALNDWINRLDPDLIIGWNVVGFDFKLLLKRAEIYQLKLKLGRNQSPINWREAQNSQQGFVNIAGRVIVDGIDALKTASYSFESFSLDFVSQQLLGRGKIAEDVENRLFEIEHNFRYQKAKLAAYNLEDCRLVLDIFKHTQIVDFLCLRSQLTGLALDRSGGSVAAFSNLYLPRLHRAGYVAPNLNRDFVADSPGGYVMSSRPGLYQHVLVLDFKSLYPSIIRTFKIDPVGLLEGLKSPETAIEGYRGGLFSRDHHYLPNIIDTLWQQRDEAKRNKDAPRSQAIKILMNSFYGVLGSTGCRFHDPRLASSITMRGHWLMKQTASWIEENEHYQVIYGDTDSTFVWLKTVEGDHDAQAIGRELAQNINQLWDNYLREHFDLESHLEIEFETHFKQFLMPTIRHSELGSKKRYAGLDQNDEIIIKGLETVRSDWTQLAKQFQRGLLERVFAGTDTTEFVLSSVANLLEGQCDELLIYKKRLRRKLDLYQKNIPPQVRAARGADEKNQALGKRLRYQNRGSIRYIMTMDGPQAIEYQDSAIDYQHYLDKQLKPIADAILPFVDLDFGALTDQQLGLF
ncbi:DNA polymerase II [Alginatibacterium sediminis]|uniref:DNA polymerase n=1 Tax=Alginatibacterium sediminis TaxID=2164068 RepID=A0A420END3_9ALTE|nr:DNA polymerase II [Alginatibacterium sediminis]RKF22212.1 DNA polymerase II [Alginatibacterium sediminis]